MTPAKNIRLPADEVARLATLAGYRVLDTPTEAAYDDIAMLAARLCAAPIALVTFVDRDRVWFKSRLGLEADATPREGGFCAEAVLDPDAVLIVPDARADPRFQDNPLVTGPSRIRFYAGAPLVTRAGHALGTLCVLDRVPRALAPEQEAALRALRRQVVNELEMRRHAAGPPEPRAAPDVRDVIRHFDETQAIGRIGSWELDPVTGRGLWSAGMHALYGRPAAAGPPSFDEFVDLVHPDDRAAVLASLESVRSVRPVLVAFRTNPARGPVRHLENSVGAVAREGGVILEGVTRDVTEHAELVERERWARGVAETLGQANLALAREARLEEVLETILDHLGRLVPYDSASVMLLDADRGLSVRAARRYEHWTDAGPTGCNAFAAGSNPLLEAVLRSGQPILVPDSREESAWQRVAGGEHVRSWLGVPLVHQGRAIGLFSVDKAEPGFFTEEHLRVSRDLAPAAATAIANARLLARLRGQEARLRLAVGAGQIGLFDWDRRAERVYYSPEWKRQIGYEEHELADDLEEWRSRVHPDDLPRMVDTIERYVEKPWPDYEAEFRFRHKDGSYRWILSRADVQMGADGKPDRILGCHIDITGRKRIEADLMDSRQRLQTIIRSEPECVKLVGRDGSLQGMNPAGLAMIEADSEAQVLGKSIYSIVVPESRAAFRALTESVFEGGSGRLEFEIVGVKGGRRWLETQAVPLRGPDGEVQSALGLTRDVTERKRSQEALRTLSHKLLVAQEEERRRIARELHDQIGQVLTAVKLTLQGLPRQPTLEAALARIPRAIETVDQAIGQVRSLSLDLRPSLLDDLGLPAALRWYVDRQTRDAGIAGHVTSDGVEARMPPEVVTACFRVTQEAVTNVLRHARATRVWVELRRSGGDLELRVRDDGAGFDPAEARARTASGKCMGLSGMQERVALAGGQLDVASAPGSGTQVVVRFPLPEAPIVP